MKKILILSTISLLVLIRCEEDIIKTENHKPIIFSLTAFPDVVSLSDSVIIICNAIDPDADTLVYDWSTDGKSKIKGAQNPDFILYHTYENSRVVYPENNITLPDTLWVTCVARDVKGGSMGKSVSFIVKQDSSDN
jgi:hypothetical protein